MNLLLPTMTQHRQLMRVIQAGEMKNHRDHVFGMASVGEDYSVIYLAKGNPFCMHIGNDTKIMHAAYR